MTTPDIRALLHPGYELGDGSADGAQQVGGQWWHPVMGCDSLQFVVDNALATPPPVPPTVMQILDLSGEIEDAGLGQIDLVRAALERWGHR
jgi:hypothetical protein